MAVSIPTAEQAHTTSADSLSSFTIGSPEDGAGVKNLGNLPITNNATSWRESTDGTTSGYLFPFSSPMDVSSDTKLLVWSLSFNSSNRIQVDTISNAGVFVRLASGGVSTNYRDYYIGGNDTPLASYHAGPVPFVIDLNATGQDASSGTYDNTDIQHYGLAITCDHTLSAVSSWLFVQGVYLLDTNKNGSNIVKFTGTSDFNDLIDEVLGSDYTDVIGVWVQKISDTYFVPVAFQIGDSSTATVFNDNGATVVSPADNQSSDPRYRLTTQATRVYVVLRDNTADSATFSGIYVWSVASPWDLDVNNLSSINIEGANFQGMGDFTVGSSVSGAAMFNLASGSDVVINGANLDGSTITGDVILKTVTDMTGVTITGSLTIETAGTYDFTDCNISEVINTSGGNVNIESRGSTITTNTGPNITIETYNDLTLTGLQDGTEVRVYDAGTTTEIDGVESSSGGTFTTEIAESSVDIAIHHIDYLYQRLESVAVTSDVSIPISQVSDRNYENP